jgi:hypothetical protein
MNATILLGDINARLKPNNLADDVRLISVLVAKDAQQAEGFVDAYKANAANNMSWKFLTTDEVGAQLRREVLASIPSSGKSALSDRVFLIDPQGDLRAIYGRSSIRDSESIIGDLQSVLDERVVIIEGRLFRKIPNELLDPVWLARRKGGAAKDD